MYDNEFVLQLREPNGNFIVLIKKLGFYKKEMKNLFFGKK